MWKDKKARCLLKDYQSAIANYNKALEIDPNYAKAYNNRGLTRIEQQDYPAALADFDKGISINPSYADENPFPGCIAWERVI